MEIGNRLKDLRKEKGLTQSQVAQEIFVSRESITKYENNEKTPSVEILCRLADFYDCTTDFILGRED